MRWVVGACIAITLGAVTVIAAAPSRAETTELCRFDSDELAEISGLAYSSVHEGIVWAHNDSGGGPKLYAIDVADCGIRAVLTIRGVAARDPEAIAIGTSSTGASVIWWGDVGDNTAERRRVEIHEIPEPRRLRDASVDAITYPVRLDEPEDAEALLADGDQLWLIGKGLLGGTVWQLPTPLSTDGASRARAVGEEEALVTDAAMRPGGGYAVRDYSEVRIYSGVPPGKLLARTPLPDQVQGEAMTWTPDGTSLIVASEGDDRLLLVPIDVPADAPAEGSGDPPPAEPTPSPPVPSTTAPVTPTAEPSGGSSPSPVAAALQPVDRVGSLAVMALAIGGAVFIVSVVAVAVVARVRTRR